MLDTTYKMTIRKCIENEGIDTSADDFTEEKMFEIITDLICENI